MTKMLKRHFAEYPVQRIKMFKPRPTLMFGWQRQQRAMEKPSTILRIVMISLELPTMSMCKASFKLPSWRKTTVKSCVSCKMSVSSTLGKSNSQIITFWYSSHHCDGIEDKRSDEAKTDGVQQWLWDDTPLFWVVEIPQHESTAFPIIVVWAKAADKHTQVLRSYSRGSMCGVQKRNLSIRQLW